MKLLRSDDFKSREWRTALVYIEAADEDLVYIDYSASIGYYPPAQVCMHAARYSEKIIKAKLAMNGVQDTWGHDQEDLLNRLPDFPNKERAIEIANVLTTYATQAAYPSRVRERITYEKAKQAAELAIEMPYLLGIPSHYVGSENRKTKKSIISRLVRHKK